MYLPTFLIFVMHPFSCARYFTGFTLSSTYVMYRSVVFLQKLKYLLSYNLRAYSQTQIIYDYRYYWNGRRGGKRVGSGMPVYFFIIRFSGSSRAAWGMEASYMRLLFPFPCHVTGNYWAHGLWSMMACVKCRKATRNWTNV
jgi:hypothetical protein